MVAAEVTVEPTAETLPDAGGAPVEARGPVPSHAVRFRVLGPIDLEIDGRTVEIAAPKERLVLATLLTSPNRVVPVASLLDELWGDQAPASAHKTLQTYISHLRRLLGERIATVPPGYLVRIEPGELDASEFERVVAEARLALLRDDAPAAARLFGESLETWRGGAFDGVASDRLVYAEGMRLDELRLAATEDWYEARLGAGDHHGAAASLEKLVTRHPLRERLWSLLMQALYREGRQAEALRAFQRARSVLVDELGLEPGPELRAVEAAVLGQRLGIEVGAEGPDDRRPVTRYATNDEGMQIGYWTYGSGPRDLVFLGEVYMNLELVWELTELLPIFEQLSADHRVVSVQRRGTGVSDRAPDESLAPPQACLADIDAVLDAVGAGDQVALVGWGHGGQLAIAYAAARPDRVSKIVAVNSYARLSATAGYPDGLPAELLDAWLALVSAKWGKPESGAAVFGHIGDDPAFMARVARLERLIASPRTAIALHRALNDFDVRPAVPSITCPALVVHLEHSVSGRRGAEWLAQHLPRARFVELPGHFVPTALEAAALGREVVEFLLAGDDGVLRRDVVR